MKNKSEKPLYNHLTTWYTPRMKIKDAAIEIRVTTDEKRRIQEAAARESINVSPWCRQQLLKAVERAEQAPR